MVQKTILFILALIPLFSLAQQQQVLPFSSYTKWAETFPVITTRTKNEQINLSWLKTNLPEIASYDQDLKDLYTKQSKIGTHTFYQHYLKGKPVWGSYIKVDALRNGETIIHKHLVSVSEQPGSISNILFTHWLVMQNTVLPVFVSQSGDLQSMATSSGELIFERDMRRFFHHDDTLVTGKVFQPDPLSSAGVIYGQDGIWLHYNDSDYALINNERKLVSFNVTVEGDSFVLKNQYVQVIDFAPPFNGITKSATPSFDFLRSTSHFKNVMVYYHINHTQKYLQGLNYSLVQYPIKVDASATTGDNSFFRFDPDTSLNFGLGGVPDAEDADVIVHEYTHAVSYDINPTPNMITERLSIEEGTCDVMAALRSKQFTPFNYRSIFNYDGPNPVTPGYPRFWAGRNGNSSKTYDNKIGSVYADSEIWSSCMLDISEAISPDTLMDILLTSISLFTSTTTMPQAAQAMLITDSLLYNGKHMLTMGIYFNARKFGNFPVGLVEQKIKNETLFAIYNSVGFANGNEPMTIQIKNPKPYHLRIIDVQGRVVYNKQNEMLQSDILPDGFTSGMYILQVIQEGETYSQRIARF